MEMLISLWKKRSEYQGNESAERGEMPLCSNAVPDKNVAAEIIRPSCYNQE